MPLPKKSNVSSNELMLYNTKGNEQREKVMFQAMIPFFFFAFTLHFYLATVMTQHQDTRGKAMETQLNGGYKLQLQTMLWLMEEIHCQLDELDNQGLIDDDNFPDILSHLAAAAGLCRKAKWHSVNHLKVV